MTQPVGTIGFIGTGHMGLPLARNLLRAGIALRVWNRTAEKCEELVQLGASRAASAAALFRGCDTVFVMLLNEAALDAVLARGTAGFAALLSGKTLVQLGTTSPDYSAALAGDVRAAGGAYVEAPVSGSRVPAEQGQLVCMLAGDEADMARIQPLLAPLCARVFRCGAVPGALRMKLAVNHFLIGLVTVLAETVHAARAAGVDLATLRQVLDAGPMASAVSRGKLEKLVRGDFSAQAAIRDVRTIAHLVSAQCAAAAAEAPLIGHCAALYRQAEAAGHGDCDMSAVIHAFAAAARDATP
ncbi:NAD(P)-dependent oxidoreductase [Tahibacter harae]|uniref:NAD(P)-dependent oxidoreductase n=1 Tax=Tahibacter harae TaxID=2963937 RepID=A0ABT1QNR9_9GAMM|nr:NAD(P)-dependent oxidoreductase [Tahibacter harae]